MNVQMVIGEVVIICVPIQVMIILLVCSHEEGTCSAVQLQTISGIVLECVHTCAALRVTSE